MKKLLFLFPLLLAGVSSASVVSVNFVGNGAEAGTLAPADLAGSASQAAFVPNWTNAAGATGNLVNLTASDGTASGVSLTYAAGNGTWALPANTAGANLSGGANPAMMRGYLDSFAGATPTLLNFSGLPVNQLYSLIVYFDGDNAGDWRLGNYTVSGALTGNTMLFGEDSEGTNFNTGAGQNPDGLFQIPAPGAPGNAAWPASPNNSEGNMVVFSGLSGSGFLLTAEPGGGGTGTLRAAVNGVQIVLIPEAGSSALGLLAGLALLARRRR